MTTAATAPFHRWKRLVDAELLAIGRELRKAQKGKDAGVHRARKGMQRLRSLLRLVRRAAPDWVARTDAQLRGLRRRLGRLRDASVRVELMESLLKRCDDERQRPLLQAGLLQLRARRTAAWAALSKAFWVRVSAAWMRVEKRVLQAPVEALRPGQIDRSLDHARRRLRAELREALGSLQRGRRHNLRRHLRRYAAMRHAAASVLRRRDTVANRLIDTARSLGEEGDLWLTCTALRACSTQAPSRELGQTLEQRRRALCKLHDGELVSIRRATLGKPAGRARKSVPEPASAAAEEEA